jgi:hypothetical protein
MATPARRPLLIAAFLVLDILAVGLGMGVPIFAILLGFPLGWFLPDFLGLPDPLAAPDLKRLLRYCLLTSLVTLLLMAIIWLPALRLLAGPTGDIANFGVPMILYEPLASFIGWIVLMVFISPALQMLATLSAAVTRCAFKPYRMSPLT